MSGIKHDAGKPPMSLLPFGALTEVAKVLEHGKTKYAAHNWREGFDWSRLSDSGLRHISSFLEGRDHDEESGLYELAHAACCILFLLEHQIKGYGRDDRYGARTQAAAPTPPPPPITPEQIAALDKMVRDFENGSA